MARGRGGRGGRVRGRVYNPLSSNDDDRDVVDGMTDNSNEASSGSMEDNSHGVDVEEHNESNSNNNRSIVTPMQRRREQRRRRQERGQQYSRVSLGESNEEDEVGNDANDCAASTSTAGGSGESSSGSSTKKENNDSGSDEDGSSSFNVIILDSVQHRFSVKADPKWKVEKLKRRGEKVHKIPPPSQRLIYRGKLLTDESTLEESGITESDVIIHLFPKPRVVVLKNNKNSSKGSANNNSNSSGVDDCNGTVATLDSSEITNSSLLPSSSSSGEDDDENVDSSDSNNPSGAHVPQIVLDADEAERRSSILVLGSPYFVEAQNNVKLLSFLLLVVSCIELINLFAVMMGVPQQDPAAVAGSYDDNMFANFPTDDSLSGGSLPLIQDDSDDNHTSNATFAPSSLDPNDIPMEPWKFSNNIDLVISAVGFYVALIGIQATNENTLRLAKKYMYGTFVVGVAWMVFNYFMTVQFDKQVEQERIDDQQKPSHHASNESSSGALNPGSSDDLDHMYDSDYYVQSLQVMVLPGMVWILCCVRAWQFHYLLQEAEREAQQRITNELEIHNNIQQNVENNNRHDLEQGASSS